MKNNELYHHGVKGQKWGVRKDRYRTALRRVGRATGRAIVTTGRVAGKAIKSVVKGTGNAYRQHKINKEARRQRRVEKIVRSGNAKTVSKNIKKLSSSELQEAMNRINMNRQLKSIYNSKSMQSKQDGIVKNSLKNAARNVLTNTATTMLSDIALGRNPITAYKGRMETAKRDTNINNTQQAVRQMNLDKQLSLLRYDPGVRVRAVVNKSAQKKLRSISINHFDFDINELYHDSLMHYGVKGQKWGVRKDKISKRIEYKDFNWKEKLSHIKKLNKARGLEGFFEKEIEIELRYENDPVKKYTEMYKLHFPNATDKEAKANALKAQRGIITERRDHLRENPKYKNLSNKELDKIYNNKYSERIDQW